MSSSTLYAQDPLVGKGFWRLAAVFAVHALILGCLIYYQGVRPLPAASSEITVSLMAPPAPEVVPPQPEPPQPVVKKVVEQRKILVAQTQAPSTFTAAAPDPVPTPPAPSAPAASAVAVEPIIDPNFNANYLNNPKPEYPRASRRMKEEGTVYLRALVNTNGLPDQVVISKSSGYERLDTAALDAVKRWKFVPARQGPVTVTAWVNIPLSFSLNPE